MTALMSRGGGVARGDRVVESEWKSREDFALGNDGVSATMRGITSTPPPMRQADIAERRTMNLLKNTEPIHTLPD